MLIKSICERIRRVTSVPSFGDFHVVSVDAQGKGGPAEGVQGIIDIVAFSDERRDVIFISEADFVPNDALADDINTHISLHLTWRVFLGVAVAHCVSS